MPSSDPAPALPTKAVVRAWDAAPATERVALLERLLQPVGPLARLAVASGAFSMYFLREHWTEVHVRLEDAARFSADEVLELARFATDVQPDVLQGLANGAGTAGMVGVVGLAAALLVAVWRR